MSAQSDTQDVKVGIEQGGDTLFAKSGGTIRLESGATLDLQSGATVKGAGGAAINWDRYVLCIDIADMSADADYYLYIPAKGTIKTIGAIVDGAISTADITVTPLVVGGSAMTDGVVTLATAASGAGTKSSSTPSVNNTVVAGDALKLTVAGGGSGGSPKGHIVVEIQRT